MNTSALKRFAQQARNILKSGVEKQLIQWGYNPKTKRFETEPQVIGGGALFGSKMIEDTDFNSKWQALRGAVHAKGAGQVVEEAAYTWFNRLMAIRILAKNGYIPAQMEYTSAESRITTIVQAARQGITPRLDENGQRIFQSLIEDDTRETELFSLLITAYCYENELLQRIFGRIDDYTGLLLPTDILAQNGFIELLNTTDAISYEDYTRVELIGWLYQFYISEKKNEVDSKPKVELEDIPAATQIFTPNWIVKYMVENTVGRLWLDLNPDSRLRESMCYLVKNLDVKMEPLVSEVDEIKLLDPACGSGHILVEGFDLLFAIYREEHYTAREAIDSIFSNNLFGLDIDLRAVQLTQFALLLKAAAVDRSVITRNIIPHIYAMPDRITFTEQEVEDFLGREGKDYVEPLRDALQLMEQSQNLGSIMKFNFTSQAYMAIFSRFEYWNKNGNLNLIEKELWYRIKSYIQVLLVLIKKYEVVVTNPPYLVSGKMNNELLFYTKKVYPLTCGDLSSIFMDVSYALIRDNGYFAMINQSSWAFKTSFFKFRKYIIDKYYIETFLELGSRTFDEISGEVVQSVCFTTLKQHNQSNKVGYYFKLIEPKNSPAKKELFLQIQKSPYKFKLSLLSSIPEHIFGYWLSKKAIELFRHSTPICKEMEVKKGIATGKDTLFLRLWHELNYWDISYKTTSSNNYYSIKWFPINKGGGYRKWAGNTEYVVNWLNDGEDIKTFKDENGKLKSRPQNLNFSFQKGVTYNIISSKGFIGRYTKEGFMMADVSPTIYNGDEMLILPLLNSVVGNYFFKLLCPSYKYDTGNVGKFPLVKPQNCENNYIKELCFECVEISKSDWDSRETSWDFQQSPLIATSCVGLEQAYNGWVEKVTQDFAQLHANETELNRIFIDIYGLQDELTPEVKLKDITILQDELDTKAFGDATELQRELPIKTDVVMGQLISYAVGCMMGRYRLDKRGLYIAHPNPADEEVASYSFNGRTFQIDEDGIIPLMDNSASFTDNALARLKEFFALVWGEEELVNTLNFVEQGLGTDLESYLVKVFWKEHCKRYQKRPIYWLFASPKGAFQVLTYMHRMNRFTVEKIRSHYLLKHISNLENRVGMLQSNEASLNTAERRLLEKLQKDLAECRAYDLELKEVADAQIEFDLDDGVAVNYELFKKVVAPIK